MSLEVHIYGPGFGETIFLRWPRSGGGWHGALVDAHSPDDGQWLAQKLRILGLTELEFVVATHPHLDHILNLAAGLERSAVSVGCGFFWPPFMDTSWIQFFDRLAAQRDGDLPKTAKMIRQWFGYWDKQYETRQTFPRSMEGRNDFRNEYSSTIQGEPLLVKAIGPWDAITSRLAVNVSTSRQRSGRIDYEHRHANDVSIALLIEYGNAQIVLGGDMEEINWNSLTRRSNRPLFRPSIVKVSHHASTNGRISGMWRHVGGFLDGMAPHPVTIVTPWKQGAGKLPDSDVVLNEIRQAGFAVYVTGQGSHRFRNPDSHVSVQVQPDGVVRVIDRTPDVRRL